MAFIGAINTGTTGGGGGQVVLICCNNRNISNAWAQTLCKNSVSSKVVDCQAEAIEYLRDSPVRALILDLLLTRGSAIAIADFAAYRQPQAKVIFVSKDTHFSDGSIFNHISNAYAYLRPQTPPEDMAAIVEYHLAS